MLQKFDAFFTSEISISIKLLDVSVFMFAIVYQLYSSTVFPVSCSDKLLKAKLIEVNLKVPDEIRLSCIIAVAVYYFAFEMFFIMF